MASVLVVEDDAVIGRLVESALQSDGHTVTWVRLGSEAVRVGTGASLDLVLLDLGLPDVDGLLVCRRLRQTQPSVVIVMLTARRDEMDVVEGLESGADDYLTKPFSVAELVARVRAHLRRAAPPVAEQRTFHSGDLSIDLEERRCRIGETEIPLRSKEFDLLARLMMSAGQALSRDTLMADVWSPKWFGSTKTLDVHVAALRRQLDTGATARGEPARVPAITTLRGFGYRLEALPAD